MSDYSHLFDDVTPESDEFAALSMSIIDRIRELNQQRGWTQKQLSEQLGKKESEVSKWMGGLHNLTLRNVARLNVAFGEPVVCVPGMRLPSVQATWEAKAMSFQLLDAPKVRCEGPSVNNDYFSVTTYAVSAQPPKDLVLPEVDWNEFNEAPAPQSTMAVVHLQAA